MAEKRSVDEYLGFASRAVAKRVSEHEVAEAATLDDGAYEDSWYQVLKAKSDDDEHEPEHA
ncbi:MAG: hypothetical protein OEV60_04815 [Actinomycetota bacterium]|nr:hypothetical protein [Actinomycetota bacterium]MDH5223844.1 hypothetical protein [Actinomycetota bacterium]MDH5312582.1 hypothetical protein [Actinomycetota bacterium]